MKDFVWRPRNSGHINLCFSKYTGSYLPLSHLFFLVSSTVLLNTALIPCSLNELNRGTEAWEKCDNLYPFLISQCFSRFLYLFSSGRDDDDGITWFSGIVQSIQRTSCCPFSGDLTGINQQEAHPLLRVASLSLSIEPPKALSAVQYCMFLWQCSSLSAVFVSITGSAFA